MEVLFLKILNLSINAAWLILAVLALRIILRKAPKWVFCALWGLVGIRLVCPFSVESAFSLIPSGQVIPDTIAEDRQPVINTGITALNHVVNPVLSEKFSPEAGASVNPLQVYVFLFSIIWAAGIILFAVYALVTDVRIKKKAAASIPLEKGVMCCDDINTAFILGMIQPVIYMPSFIDKDTYALVLAHERAHIKRRDYLWKPLGFALLAVYWFNPFCWIAYILLCRDIEAACDEKVIQGKEREYIAEYSQALLRLSVPRRFISACPLAFGENGVKGRIKNILNYRKPAFWIITASIVLLVVSAMCFLTDPRPDKESNISVAENNKNEEINIPDNSIPVSRPVVDLSDLVGADFPELLYADSDKIIFRGYFGLFVYSKKEHRFITSLDLEPIGCAWTQGDDACFTVVSEDGRIVYMRPMSSDEMYLYDTVSDTLSKRKFNLEGIRLHTIPEIGYDGTYDTWKDGKKKVTTKLPFYEDFRWMLGNLGYMDTSKDDSGQFYPFFSPDGLSGARDFTPDDIHDIASADIWVSGHLPPELKLGDGENAFLHCDSKDILKELEDILSRAKVMKGETGCPFHTALYLTREDGTVGWIFPATDTCFIYKSAGKCYQVDEGSNEKLWSLISQFDRTNSYENDRTSPEEDQQVESENKIGLSMFITNINNTGGTLVFTQSGGHVTGELETGTEFELQVQNPEGKWIDDSSRDFAKHDIAKIIKQNGTTEMPINWKQAYGFRESGHYRLVKKVVDFRGVNDYDEYELSVEFDIM